MHPTDKDLELHRLGLLSSRQSSTVKSHLLECKLCESKIELLLQLSRWQGGTVSVERRVEDRTPSDEAASLRILRGSYESIECQVLNQSKGGMGLRLPEPLEPGTVVQIRLKNTIVMAEVRYCRRAGAEFHAGVKVEDVVQISTKEPQD